tara:strand:- start:282 stop:794 length:513 start_codon:yes stop_codon:yes gene_type:complete
MTIRTTPLLALATALSLAYAAPALAHGTKQHDGARASAAIADAEQMPWGIAGASSAVGQTIEVAAHDRMRFVPESITVKQGETVRFVINNDAELMHEFVLGTSDSNETHAALMLKFPGMEHDAPYMAHMQPGGKGEVVWTFNEPGTFEFACLIAGHYQAGMVGTIKVVAD